MKRVKYFLMILSVIFLVGCSEEKFTSINYHQSFVASMNILESSLTFFDETSKKIAHWQFEKSYTGALFVPHDRVLLYGHKVSEADLYELSSGKLLSTIKTGIGSTNAYYDVETNKLFITNSERNSVTSYDNYGNRLVETQVGDYPMSMAANDGLLYVINYKDTKLSVINIEKMALQDEWPISESSNGILIVPENDTLWLGGHGEGNKVNQTVDVLNLNNGELLDQLDVSIMPVALSRNGEEVLIINHGSNELYATNLDGQTLWNLEVGANPFTVAPFFETIIVAGFDDHKVYFVEDGKIVKTMDTGSGPFQLLVREVE